MGSVKNQTARVCKRVQFERTFLKIHMFGNSSVLGLVLVCTGVGMLMSALYVFFRDLSYFYELLTFFLWISSPIFYPKEIVPEEVKKFLLLNHFLDL